MLLLHHALKLRAKIFRESSEWGIALPKTLGHGGAARFEIGAPGETCTHSLPADNGLLFYSATEAKWWEALDHGSR